MQGVSADNGPFPQTSISQLDEHMQSTHRRLILCYIGDVVHTQQQMKGQERAPQGASSQAAVRLEGRRARLRPMSSLSCNIMCVRLLARPEAS